MGYPTARTPRLAGPTGGRAGDHGRDAPGVLDRGRNYQKVSLERVEALVRLGVYPHERQAPQRVSVDVELVRFGEAYAGGGLDGCLDYDRVRRHLVEAWPLRPHTGLLEELAEDLVRFCLADRRVDACRVVVRKPDAYTDPGAGVPSVEVFRGREDA